MKKMIPLAAILSVLFLAVASQAAAAAAPKISFDEVYWELGTQPQGISVYHDVIITNTGDAPLTITDVDPPCGCTIVDRGQYPLVLTPGESHTVNVSFQTGTYSGLITRNIAVSSDDPTAPVSQLTFTTNVVPYYTVTSTVSFAPTTYVPAATTAPTTYDVMTPFPTTTEESPVSLVGVIVAITISALLLRRYAR